MKRSAQPWLLLVLLLTFLASNVAEAQVRRPARAQAKVTPTAKARQAAPTRRTTPTTKKKAANSKVGLKGIFKTVKENFQVYKGDRIEGWANRMKVGRSDFNGKHSVQKNLAHLVQKKGMEHYYAKIDGRDVLHVVVNLGKGKSTKESMRDVLRRVGGQTVELNYKASTAKNPYGHVAVRVGNGAFYDLTGTRGVATLPKFMERTLAFMGKSANLTFARKRNLRRFMESRGDNPQGTAYYGMLFAASSSEVKQTQALYNERLKQATSFNVSGGDAKKGEFSCAQFLTESVPFFNSRGVGKNIGAKSTTEAAKGSLHLEAVVVYKSASTPTDGVQQYP